MKKELIIAIAITIGVFYSCKKKETEETVLTNNSAAPVSLLSGAQTGQPFTTGMISDFTLASKGSIVALVISTTTPGKIYAIELNDNDASQASGNAIVASVNIKSSIAQQMGTITSNVEILNMEVNPISKSLYVLAGKISGSAYTSVSIFKITSAGAIISLVDLSNVSYSSITYTTSNKPIKDMTWGDNTLFVSMGAVGSLDGEIATIPVPFVHNTTTTNRSTTVFKTNWGGEYYTDAPLEQMVYGEVDGEKRLMGVTVCAPGFSFKTSEINGSGLLEVKEYFNLNTGFPVKVVSVTQDGTTYLIECHETGRITRIGEKYLNGSQSSNANVTYLLKNLGTVVVNGLTDSDVKILKTSGYTMIAKYSDTQLYILGNSGNISLLDI